MTLQGYLARLADTLHSRHDITLEELRLMLTTVGAIFQANARFYTHTCPLFLIIGTRVIPLSRQPRLTWPMFCARLMH